jgi:3-oxoacyl-(acyl-carrier-protein) synthase
MFVLENAEAAEARGARAHCEILGFTTQRDVSPEEPASGLEQSMKVALSNACCAPEDIDYISAYGPGHPFLDAAEVAIIKKVFGKHAYAISISSIKGVTGNPLAAAGPFQIAAAALSFRHHLIPPTANYETPDPACDLDVVPNRARRASLNRTLINVRGLGGSASTMALQRAGSN